MRNWDKDDKLKTGDISTAFIGMILIFALAFFIGLFWGMSIGADMENQKAFGESTTQENLQVALNDTLGISDKITTHVTRGTGIL